MGKRLIQIKASYLLFTTLFLINCASNEDPVNQLPKKEDPAGVGAPQSLTNRPGRNRIELSWTANSGINIQSYKIFWNNRKDSITGEVPTTNQPGTIRVMLSNLDEGLYQFYVSV